MMIQNFERTHRSPQSNTRTLSILARTHVLINHYLLRVLLHITRTIRANTMGSKLSNMIFHPIGLKALVICGLVLSRHVATGCMRVRQQMEWRESRHILKPTPVKLRRRSILLIKKVVPTYPSSMFGRCLVVLMLIISRNLVRRIQALAPEPDSAAIHDKTGHPSPIKIRF